MPISSDNFFKCPDTTRNSETLDQRAGRFPSTETGESREADSYLYEKLKEFNFAAVPQFLSIRPFSAEDKREKLRATSIKLRLIGDWSIGRII